MLNESFIESGTILKIDDDFTDVLIHSKNECEECSAKIFCTPTSANLNVLRIQKLAGKNVGDDIKIEINSKSIVSQALIIYLLPLIILLIVVALTYNLFSASNNKELLAFTGAIISLVVYFFLLNLKRKFFPSDQRSIVNILN
ncbi:MAG: SoxR reducing system RseC family protein [Melioribacteraceae bacterium]|jgi:sigma-E factor negative regulatory protein RseC|nr:SoxR reducing system RseC family protein [Melioribacteraceae bacterium]